MRKDISSEHNSQHVTYVYPLTIDEYRFSEYPVIGKALLFTLFVLRAHEFDHFYFACRYQYCGHSREFLRFTVNKPLTS